MNDSMLEQRKQLEEEGYCIIPNVLTDSECNKYVDLLNRDYDKWSQFYKTSKATSHSLNDKSSEKVVYNMHNKDIAYFDLFDHQKVFPVIESVLQSGSYQNSESVNLLNISARNPAAYADAQQLHLDSNLPGKESFPLIIVALFMLEDFTEENGATRIVPGSHKFDCYAEDGKEYSEEIRVTGKKGSVLLFNGSLWHGSSKKFDDSSRWSIILGYGRWFIKPSFDFCRNIPDSIYKQLSDSRKRLLGLDSMPPKDEFTRITRRSEAVEWESGYELPR